jgi:hypothetical protein
MEVVMKQKTLTKADVEQAVSNVVAKTCLNVLVIMGIFWLFENGMWYLAIPALFIDFVVACITYESKN